MPLASGETFAGFRVVRMLGSGAMGEVYLVQHPRLPRRDALKVLSATLTADGAFRERFNREADTVAALWHPHIVGVHDRGEFEGHLWISMDFVDGTDAAQLLDGVHRNGMPVQRVLRIISAVADALDYAHQHRLLHRDVKPANILIGGPDSGDRIVLADFGIAKQLGEVGGLTQTNMAIGTVAYSAPEQLSGAPLDGRADQYALAATAFHLLVGSQPYQHSNPAVVVAQHLTAPPPIIGERRPDLAILQPAFSTAMAKNPGMRYSRCAEFSRELERLLNTGPTQSAIASPSAPGFARPPQAPARRNRLWLGVAAAAVLTAALAAVVVVIAVQSGSGDQGTASTGDTSASESAASSTSRASASSSSARESERQASMTTEAIHSSCEALSSSSVDAITAVNNYVYASNQYSADVAAKASLAVDALDHSADLVARSVTDELTPNLRDALNAWVDAARGLATAIAGNHGPDQFNVAITRLNDTKTTALNLCDAAYR